MKQPSVFCILGPTGSGKTSLAERLAVDLDAEIINVDMGQFYTSLAIGTAKPEYQATPFKQHLFDICDTPCDYNVMEYRKAVAEVVADIHARKKSVLLVGGSLFYVKALFFPPQDFAKKNDNIPQWSSMATEDLWSKLHEIDPVRAEQLHVHDRYRIERALTLFYSTGQLPSACLPIYDPLFEPNIIWLDGEKEILDQRIAQRTKIMLESGWIEEVEVHCSDEWYSFYERKGLIGYKILADWICAGKNRNEIDRVAQEVVRATVSYAKRQKTFFKSFLSVLRSECDKDAFFYRLINYRYSQEEYFSLLRDLQKRK